MATTKPPDVAEAEGQRQGPLEAAAPHVGAGTRAGTRTRETVERLTATLVLLLGQARAGLAAWWSHDKTAAERAAPDPLRSSLWSQAPASPADVLAYTRSGAWVPGDRAAVLEAAGKVYGYGIALPATLGLYAAAWTLQRPTRLLATVVFVALLVASWGS